MISRSVFALSCVLPRDGMRWWYILLDKLRGLLPRDAHEFCKEDIKTG